MNFFLKSVIILLVTLPFLVNVALCQSQFDAEGTLWAPFLEWEVENSSYETNPFDVQATVTFVHEQSAKQVLTYMFYAGDKTWKWRFSGTEIGNWVFTTASEDPELDGHQGTVLITPNPDPAMYGYLTQHSTETHTKWARRKGNDGIKEVFTPQFVMFDSNPANFYNNTDYVDASIELFLGTHGFSGFHLAVIGSRWFNMDAPENALSGNETDPDPRTFDALELLITRVHAAGGVVHIWPWGDASRDQVPLMLDGGANGPIDERLQRYIAARLGQIPGWSMGYGFDLFEWTNETMLQSWHTNMQSFLGRFHYLGGRAHKNQLSQIYEGFGYSAYEWHRPTYEDYIAHSTTRPEKPAFSEDRFRIRNREKDYTMEETRRGLWHSTMGGGVANIWGNLKNEDGSIASHSNPYPNPEWIKTYATFWQDRFLSNMEPCNSLTNAYCLGDTVLESYVLYKEDSERIEFVLTDTSAGAKLVALVVDTKNPYAELGPCDIPASGFTWELPYVSDWAIAIGAFEQTPPSGSFDCNTLPVELNQFDAASDGEDIMLSWSTLAELNNAGFEIQYKTETHSHFQVYQFVEGNGTSNAGHFYTIRFDNFPPDTYSFRLKQIDFDGAFDYSEIISFTHQVTSAYTIFDIHPMPFKNSASLTLAVSRPQHVKAVLYDTLGRQLKTVFDQLVEAHTPYPINIEGSTLPNGSYFIMVTGDHFISNKQIILAR